MIKWGIIGAGKIAYRFAECLKNEENAELYAISGRSLDKLNVFKETYPCKMIYLDHESLLNDPEVDCVYIALPHDMHAEWSKKALISKKAVLCEKPACMNENEMVSVAETARRENILFMEGMKSKFEPAYIKVKQLIEEGSIGEIQSIKSEICFLLPKDQYGKSYHTQPDVGGCLKDCGCYCASIINDFLKGPAELKKVYTNVKDGVDYYVDAKLNAGKINAEMIVGFDRETQSRTIFTGSKGEILLEHTQRPDVIHLHNNGKEDTVIDCSYDHDDFYGEIHHFDMLFSQGKKESTIMPLNDSIQNAHLLDQIHDGFSKYTEADLAVLEEQEKIFRYVSFNSEDALELGQKIIELQKEYDRGIALRIVSEPEHSVLFQYIMKDKTEKNIMYAEEKHNAILEYGHSSAWVNISTHIDHFELKDGVLPSGGAFPVFLQNGELAASILISGLHEGKDHELIVRALSEVLGRPYPEFIKSIS